MNSDISAFDQLALSQPILKGLDAVGYETPSPIQAATIPLLMSGADLVGQAQTGTGKTAAFALPALSRIDMKQSKPQVLVLAPTRELAIQVAEAFRKYAAFLPKFHVLPVYGGQDYRVQTRALQRGVHVVVGTPGRVMDHIRRGNLQLDELKTMILDEADEMLRMGFIDDVQWILDQTPDSRQTALFSATMPTQIRNIAKRYLKDPEQITIKVKTSTADTIRQRYWSVTPRNKLDALTRILEIEVFDAMLIFVRTKTATLELSEKLEARGYACAPLNGDIQQKVRERTVDQLKRGKLDIIVATDVAARGLDVERISHVLNFDIPYDTEAYIHRIGRTGRAGRSGEAIMFVAPREKRMLQSIERATGKSIEVFNIPSNETLNQHRIEKFKQRITDAIEHDGLEFFQTLIEEYIEEHQVSPKQVAAALACELQGSTPLLIPRHTRESSQRTQHNKRKPTDSSSEKQAEKSDTLKPRKEKTQTEKNKPLEAKAAKTKQQPSEPEHRSKPATQPARKPEHKPAQDLPPMERYRVEVGTAHGAEAGNIVGAIANEAGIDSQYIGRITLKDNHSFIDLPEGMPKAIYKDLRKVWVCGQKLMISRTEKAQTNDKDVKTKSSTHSKTAKEKNPREDKTREDKTREDRTRDSKTRDDRNKEGKKRDSSKSTSNTRFDAKPKRPHKQTDGPQQTKDQSKDKAAGKDGKLSLSAKKSQSSKKRTAKKKRTRNINNKKRPAQTTD